VQKQRTRSLWTGFVNEEPYRSSVLRPVGQWVGLLLGTRKLEALPCALPLDARVQGILLASLDVFKCPFHSFFLFVPSSNEEPRLLAGLKRSLLVSRPS
jgi:hypothetical protein